MNERKQLMNMICEALQTDRCVGNCNQPHCNTVQIVCDHLLSNGVTVPVPCNYCGNCRAQMDGGADNG